MGEATIDLSECSACLCLASRRGARAITRAFDRRLRPHGIRATQFSVLVLLIGHREMSISELAEALGAERTTLTRNLAPLESKGWIAIRVDERDSRARLVTVTAKGRKAVAAALPAWRQAQKAVTAAIGAPGADALRALSGTIG